MVFDVERTRPDRLAVAQLDTAVRMLGQLRVGGCGRPSGAAGRGHDAAECCNGRAAQGGTRYDMGSASFPVMSGPARQLFDAIDSFKAIDELIRRGEAESLYLECKAPSEPRVNRDVQETLGMLLSGFANTSGGVLLCGVSTTHHQHSGLDILTQIEPIGVIASFEQQVKRVLPRLTTPPQLNCETKVLRRGPSDTKGVLVAFVPPTTGDPVLRISDNVFYFRTGDEFRPAPYEVIRRLFSVTDVPDLACFFDAQLVKADDDGYWSVPVVVTNRANAAAHDASVSVEIADTSSCEDVRSPSLRDASDINPGKRLYWANAERPLFRGAATVLGTLQVKMKVGKLPRRVLRLAITLYATRMRARCVRLTIQFAKKGFSVKHSAEEFIY